MDLNANRSAKFHEQMETPAVTLFLYCLLFKVLLDVVFYLLDVRDTFLIC